MNRGERLKEIQQLFRDVFKNQAIEISEITSMDDVDEWDSLSHVLLIDTIEKRFEIKFELRDMLDIENVGNIIELISRKTGT